MTASVQPSSWAEWSVLCIRVPLHVSIYRLDNAASEAHVRALVRTGRLSVAVRITGAADETLISPA